MKSAFLLWKRVREGGLLSLALLCLISLVACASAVNTTKTSANIITYNPKAAETNLQLAVGYLQEENTQKAKQKLLLAEQEDPKSPFVWDTYAYFYAKTGDDDKAMSNYKKALSLAPHNGKILNNFGVYLCRKGKYQTAIDYFSLAVEDKTYLTTAEAYENAGLCALSIPNKPLAKSFFLKAVSNDISLKDANIELAKMAFDDKNNDEALFYLKRYNTYHQPSSESLWLEAQLGPASIR